MYSPIAPLQNRMLAADNPLGRGMMESLVEYDQELSDDIYRLERRIEQYVDREKDFMRQHGASQEMIESVRANLNKKGRDISADPLWFETKTLAKALGQLWDARHQFDFRLITNELAFPSIRIINDEGDHWFDTRPLSDEDRNEYVRRLGDVMMLARGAEPWHLWHPTVRLMRLVQTVMNQYGQGKVLRKKAVADHNIRAVLADYMKGDEWKARSEQIFSPKRTIPEGRVANTAKQRHAPMPYDDGKPKGWKKGATYAVAAPLRFIIAAVSTALAIGVPAFLIWLFFFS